MKVLQVIPRWQLGGAENLTLQLAEGLSAKDIETRVFSWSDGGDLASRAKRAGVETVLGGGRSRFDLRTAGRLVKHIRNESYTHIHAHLFPINYWVAVIPMPRGTQRVATEHSVTNKRREKTYLRSIEQRIYRRYNALIAVNDQVRESLRGWLGSDASLVCIENGVKSSGRELQRTCDLKRLVFVGRLVQAKGLDTLINALPPLVATGSVAVVDIVGDGEERRPLEQLAREVGVADRVRFHGYSDDPEQWMAGRPIFVLPSRWEGLPLALLEAMASGCPIVATDVGGVGKVLEHGTSGVLVPPNSVEGLIEAITALVSRPAYADSLGQAARRDFSRHYTVDRMVDRHIELYSDLGSSK